MDQMPYNKITVSAICKRANVGCPTFYYHYRDKLDLTEQIMRSYIDDLRNALLLQIRFLEEGASESEAWSNVRLLRKELQKRCMYLLRMDTGEMDFHKELLNMFQEIIVLMCPDPTCSEEEYRFRTEIAARLCANHFIYVEDTGNYIPLPEYLDIGKQILFVRQERDKAKDISDP